MLKENNTISFCFCFNNWSLKVHTKKVNLKHTKETAPVNKTIANFSNDLLDLIKT